MICKIIILSSPLRLKFFKIILVIPCSNFKVPKFVAEAWEASDDGAEVAKLTTSGGGKGEWKLTLDPSTTAGLSDFVLKALFEL